MKRRARGKETADSYLREVIAIVIADAIRNEDFLLEDISQRRLEGLIGRVNTGAEYGIRGGDDLDNRLRFADQNIQLADFYYGYFAAAIARGNPRLIGIKKIHKFFQELQNIFEYLVPDVVEQMLPIFNRARKEMPFAIFDSFDAPNYITRELDGQLAQFGYRFDQRRGEYARS